MCVVLNVRVLLVVLATHDKASGGSGTVCEFPHVVCCQTRENVVVKNLLFWQFFSQLCLTAVSAWGEALGAMWPLKDLQYA